MLECTVDTLARGFQFLLTVLVLCWFAAGCTRVDDNAENKKEEVKEPVSEQESSKIKNAIVSAVKRNNHALFVALFSKPDLYDLVFADIQLPTSQRRKIESNISRGGNISAFVSQVLSGVKNSGEYRFVRRTESEDGCALLFRLEMPNSHEITYHRYELFRGYKSKVRIRDIYFYSDEDSLSKRMRQRVLQELVANEQLASISGADLSVEIESKQDQTDAYKKFIELASRQQWQQAWTEYNKLPEVVRQSREVALQRLFVAEKLGELYVKPAIDDARKGYPQNIRTEFFAIKYYRQKAMPAKIIEAVDRIISVVDDPDLNLLKLGSLIQIGQWDDAHAIIEQLKNSDNIEPTRLLIHELDLSVAEQEFDKSINVLDELKNKYRIEFQNLAELPRYAELVKSPEYKEWMNGSQ